MITSALSSRTMSAFMLSIGTSLTFESLFTGTSPPYDPDRPIPNKVEITNYDEMWINLFTIFRNIVGSVPSNEVVRLMSDDIAYVMGEEIELISELVKVNSGGKTKAVFYTSSYENLAKHYKHAKVRMDNTEKQRRMTDLMMASVTNYYKSHSLSDTQKHFKLHLKSDRPRKDKVLLMSHFAFDLLSHTEFSKMDLLESHTGVLKEKAKWYTKYSDGKNLNRLPFNECLLQIFGDSQSFHPMDKQMRMDVLEIAENSNWNPLTTDERVRYTLGNIKNPYFATIIREMW